MRFADSALKHGITEAQIRYVIEHWQPPFPVQSARDSTIEVLLFVGDDNRGRALEVVAVEEQDPQGAWDLLVFHAMRLRPTYRQYYEEVLR